MFEARLKEASLMKKIHEAVRDLVMDVNFECNNSGITLQAMDTAHVALVNLVLRGEGFELYRVDRPETLGINLQSLGKVLRCAANEDTLTMEKEERSDYLRFMFESAKSDRMSEFNMKLMDIDGDTLEPPEAMYDAELDLPSAELKRIMSDLKEMGDSVEIEVSKEGVRFKVEGDAGSGSVILRQTTGVDKQEDAINVLMNEPITHQFSIKYLNLFCKAAPLSSRVQMKLASEAPLLVQFNMNSVGSLSFYLAPKVDDDDGGD